MRDATLQLRSLMGAWRPVYARRLALHATAEAVVMAAWRADVRRLDLASAVTAWRAAVGEAAEPQDVHRQQSAAGAALAVLTARPWRRTRGALVLAARRAHRAGWAAGHRLTGGSHVDDDGPLPGQLVLGAPEMSDDTADATAAATLAAALGATAWRSGRAMADSADDPQRDAEEVLDAGLDMALAADVAVSAAYGAGLLSAYLGAGAGSVLWLTAGDGRVCERCASAEAGGPYNLLASPRLPQHPRCRCVLAPA
ncbi:hypothetical protein CTZ27_33315 [Streptomyces griseocarneus]|nr:hypothetical protein CTZ27_33315 [Streptomyces griseocarneus]